MSLTESIVEDAVLEWFGELGYAVGHGPHLAPGEPAVEREPERSGDSRGQSFGEVALGRLCQAIRRPAGAGPATSEEAWATGMRYLQVRFERRQKP